MLLVLIPVAGILLGVGLWLGMRGLGAFDSLDGGGGSPPGRSSWRDRGPLSVRERVQEAPSGCLLSIVIACGVWTLAWLVVLIVGLSLMS